MTSPRVTPAFVAEYLAEIGVAFVPKTPGKRPSKPAPAGADVPAGAAGNAGAIPADAPGTLDALRVEALACRRCPLRDQATQVVFGVGNPHARLMFIGEGPGADEDAQGEPFVGAAGKRLNTWIPRLGLLREDVYIANIVKCRPPGNRAPLPGEAEVCTPWLERQIALIRPEAICLLGSTALRFLLGGEPKITRERGQWREYQGIPVLPTYHPAYILRDPRREEEVFQDMATLKGWLDAR
ncbi:MAG TPA: uracil-DNA glycosylase [Candidatus Deferrimicrobiaceae bacterium]|jgi:DNA polymerase